MEASGSSGLWAPRARGRNPSIPHTSHTRGPGPWRSAEHPSFPQRSPTEEDHPSQEQAGPEKGALTQHRLILETGKGEDRIRGLRDSLEEYFAGRKPRKKWERIKLPRNAWPGSHPLPHPTPPHHLTSPRPRAAVKQSLVHRSVPWKTRPPGRFETRLLCEVQGRIHHPCESPEEVVNIPSSETGFSSCRFACPETL